MNYYSKLASAVYNDIVGGLRGYTSNPTISIEQLEDDLAEMRLTVIKEFALKGLLPKNDLLMSINCIPVDCKNIERCTCNNSVDIGTPTLHFEIPQIMTEYDGGIEYIGSVDKQIPFKWYTSINTMKYHKYRRKGKNKPYVYIDITPNEHNLCDCWVFNTPILKKVSVIGVFKNLKQLEGYECCNEIDVNNLSFLDSEIKRRVTELKIKYYRQLAPPILPNNQVAR